MIDDVFVSRCFMFSDLKIKATYNKIFIAIFPFSFAGRFYSKTNLISVKVISAVFLCMFVLDQFKISLNFHLN